MAVQLTIGNFWVEVPLYTKYANQNIVLIFDEKCKIVRRLQQRGFGQLPHSPPYKVVTILRLSTGRATYSVYGYLMLYRYIYLILLYVVSGPHCTVSIK